MLMTDIESIYGRAAIVRRWLLVIVLFLFLLVVVVGNLPTHTTQDQDLGLKNLNLIFVAVEQPAHIPPHPT